MKKKFFFASFIFAASLCATFGASKAEVVKAAQDARNAADRTCEVLNGRLTPNLSAIVGIINSLKPKLENLSSDLSAKDSEADILEQRLSDLSRSYALFKADFERNKAYLEEGNNIAKNTADFLPSCEIQIKRGKELAEHLEGFTPNLSPAEIITFKKYVKQAVGEFNSAVGNFNAAKSDLEYEIERADIVKPLISGMENNISSTEEFLKKAEKSISETKKTLAALDEKSEGLKRFFSDLGKHLTKECARFSDLLSKTNADNFALAKFCNDTILSNSDFSDIYFKPSKYWLTTPIYVSRESMSLAVAERSLAWGRGVVSKSKSADARLSLSEGKNEIMGPNAPAANDAPEFREITAYTNLLRLSGELRNAAGNIRRLNNNLYNRYSYYESAQKENLEFLQNAIKLYTDAELLSGGTSVLASSIDIISERNKSDKSSFEKFSKEFDSAAKEADTLIGEQRKALEAAKKAFAEYSK